MGVGTSVLHAALVLGLSALLGLALLLYHLDTPVAGQMVTAMWAV